MISGGELEIFRHSLEGIVEEMGVTLERTSYSTNIKIRRDYSCALFDAECRHMAQSSDALAHIGAIVKAVPPIIEERGGDLSPGDGIIVNDPRTGGAVHLPDVMIISPVYDHAEDEIIGYVANSAHHVDIGGGTPGGIPTDSTSLYAEGLVFPGVIGIRNWMFDPEMFRLILRNVRGAETREGDYRAQVGTNRIGARRYRELHEEYGGDIVEYIDELIEYTERRLRAAIESLPDGTYEAEDYMDGDGLSDEILPIRLTLEVDGDEISIDFAGTHEQNDGPVNSSPAMTFAGAIHPLQVLVGEGFPTNEGFYRPFEIVAPEGTMVNPGPNAPIAAGGEIALRISELVTKALSVALPEDVIAGAEGTGLQAAYGGTDPRTGEEYVYYETFAGGYGARATKDGMEAVQPHCQNTANSPIESLETEIPLYVRRYELREDSAGAGRNRGGLGLRRDMEFYDHETSFTVMADRAKSPPWGLFGGEDGATSQFVINPDGEDSQVLDSKSTTVLDAGDIASIQTPGGGGYGDPYERAPEHVLRDVRNEKVSAQAAREEYGVVINTEEMTVDRAATKALRAERGTDESETVTRGKSG